MLYVEDLKLYALAAIVTIVLVFLGVFFYKWYTKPIPETYCGDFNNYVCEVGKCGYMSTYETGKVGYCQRSVFSF